MIAQIASQDRMLYLTMQCTGKESVSLLMYISLSVDDALLAEVLNTHLRIDSSRNGDNMTI